MDLYHDATVDHIMTSLSHNDVIWGTLLWCFDYTCIEAVCIPTHSH